MIPPLAASGPIPFDAILWVILIAGLPLFSGLVLLTGLARKAGGRLRLIPIAWTSWAARTWLRRSSAAVLATYAAALLYGYFIEPQWVEVTKTELRVKHPVLGRDRFRIVQLSDLHMVHFGRLEHHVVDLVREAKPDLILITGDYGERKETPVSMVELLRGIDAPYGKMTVRGNNDVFSDRPKLLEAGGVLLLRNEVKRIEEKGQFLQIAGQDVLKPLPLSQILGAFRNEDYYTIFLQHKPDAVDELAHLNPDQHVDLFLCGHTHGGQICIPGWGAVVTESKYHKKYERGLYDVGGVPMIVNRGIGVTGLPLRFLARPEVGVIDLVYR